MINERLRALRKSKGMTQKNFAELFNLTESVISLYESGKRQPSYQVLIDISKKYNISTDYLLGLTDIPASKFRYSKPVSELISKLIQMDDSDIVAISDYIDLILLRNNARNSHITNRS